ncbi:hypothetical protein VNO78_24745 [Psophocarpus tetragonolobus]|uniref:Uncharacterized protein n=1 Tax=Psophocarpus tetragonolobus TaxID=3891 RepID=A0AAN9S5U5_PSOTE
MIVLTSLVSIGHADTCILCVIMRVLDYLRQCFFSFIWPVIHRLLLAFDNRSEVVFTGHASCFQQYVFLAMGSVVKKMNIIDAAREEYNTIT